MAIMIPPVLSPEVNSAAERKMFDHFKSAPDTEDWIVLHSLGIATHNKVIYGEIDFLVLAPQLGVFALEVKGGRVRREQGVWFFTNRYGKTNHKTRGPFDQARDGIFSVIAAMKKKLDISHKHIESVFYGYGVMFPDIEYTASGVDDEQWQVFDARDGDNIRSFIERLCIGAKRKWEATYGTFNDAKLPTVSDINYIASILRGDFDCVIPLSAQLKDAQNSLITLTQEQYRCLDQIEDNPRCLVRGAAGTGKTLLAIEAAKRATALGERVALFCFNSNLAEWMSNHFLDQPDSVRPEYVGTFHKFMQQVVNSAGVVLDYPHDADEVQSYYKKMLPDAATRIMDDLGSRFDRIIVDEAQDLIENQYLDVFSRCLRKGLDRGKWIMFGDFAMQAIYANGVSEDQLISRLADYTTFIRFKLTINCRNTKPICKEIEIVTDFKAPSNVWTKVDGPPVQYVTWNTMEEQSSRLKDILAQLQADNIPPSAVTILSPRKLEHSVVSTLDGYTVENFRIPQGDHLSFCTIQGYKGLENVVIILTDIESFNAEQLMYTGLSRACSGLFILASEAAKEEYNDRFRRRLIDG